MAKSAHKSAKNDGSFIAAVIVVATLWQVFHHLGHMILSVIAVGLVATVFIRVLRYLLRARRIESMHCIDMMSGLEFEKYVADQLRKQGYNKVRLTEYYDLGIDIIAVKDGVRWGIQVKRYKSLVKAEAVRQVVTALNHYDCDRAMVITNSIYSHTAQKLAGSNGCVLVDRKWFMQEYLTS